MLAPSKGSYDKSRQRINKQRRHFANKGPYSQSYDFPVVTCGWESWITGWVPQNWCFWTVVREKTLQTPLDSKGDQTHQFQRKSTLNIHLKDWSEAEAPIHWPSDCKEPTHWKRHWCWEKSEGKRRKGWQRMRWLDGITDLVDMNLSKLWESGGQRSLACCSHGVAKSQTWLSDWTKNTLQPIHSKKFSGLVQLMQSLDDPDVLVHDDLRFNLLLSH